MVLLISMLSIYCLELYTRSGILHLDKSACSISCTLAQLLEEHYASTLLNIFQKMLALDLGPIYYRKSIIVEYRQFAQGVSIHHTPKPACRDIHT